MGVSHKYRCSGRELIPTRFALASKATSPFQGEVREKGPVLEGPEPGLVSQTASEDITAEREVAASRQLAQGMSCGSTWISFAKRTSFQSPGLWVKA
ncbi:hypothetical protein ACVIHD_005075 [Bradyrhizobium embrapense]